MKFPAAYPAFLEPEAASKLKTLRRLPRGEFHTRIERTDDARIRSHGLLEGLFTSGSAAYFNRSMSTISMSPKVWLSPTMPQMKA